MTGAIGSDTTWTAAASPYVVTGTVAVQGGATLRIEPGVTIYMGAASRLTVVSGSLRANGTVSAPIRVLSDKARLGGNPAPGDWDQWVFFAGTSNTLLERVLFEHGKGLAVMGSSPVFNYVEIRNQLGPAIAIDLSASPTGVGNRASGNTLNAISVPSGDVAGIVRWGVRGIPYLVSAGTVSVGSSPAIASVSPATVEQGQTLTLTVNGSRLDGLTGAALDQSGLTLTPFTGGSSSQAFLQLRVDAGAALGPANLRLQLDAGQALLNGAVTVTAPLPAITALDPMVVLAGLGATDITVTGRNFTNVSQVLFNSATVPTVFLSTTQLRATLPNQSTPATLQTQVQTPDSGRPGQYLTSNAVALTVQAPVPPTVAVEPTPVALPPDGKPHAITVRLSKADYRDNTLTFASSDSNKLSVSPASATIAAGQTTTTITLVPKLTGTATLTVDSTTLQRVSVPVFITADFRGANTAYAAPVGIVVQTNSVPDTTPVTVGGSAVGVSVGAVLTRVSPAAWAVGGTPTLVVQGSGIPAGAQVSLLPATGVGVGPVSVSADGAQLSTTLTTASDAPTGPRRLYVRDAAGKEIVFANPASSMLQIMAGLPAIDSIDPIFGTRGTTMKVLVRGRNLQQAQLALLPPTGLRVDSAPVVGSDGSSLTFYVEIATDAPLGAKVVQVTTPAGSTESSLLAQNAFSVVSAAKQPVTPVTSSLVGVLVGSSTPPSQSFANTAASGLVGVVIGASISDVTPNVGVTGSQSLVTARGVGLQAVNAVTIVPSTGITVTAPVVNGAGTELTFTVSVDAAAATGPRRLTISTPSGPLTLARPSDGSFLVSAPVPELTAVTPQVVLAGQNNVAMFVRGRNFTNVSAVRLEPPQSSSVTGQITASSDGTTLAFDLNVAGGAVSGPRAIVVTTAAGDSTSTVLAGNMVRIASQVGPTYNSLVSAQVGVLVGSAGTTPDPLSLTAASPAVGIMVGSLPGPDTVSTTAASATVGVVVGPVAQTVTPSGWLQGAAGSIVVTGNNLDAVTAVAVVPSTGLIVGAPVASGGGEQLSVTLSVAPDAPLVTRFIRLRTATGATISFLDPSAGSFGIGKVPSMTSIAPIVFERGKVVSLIVRGTDLRGVTRILFEAAAGLTIASAPVWSQDSFGELLTVSVLVDSAAALGSRVVRLEVPGGATSSSSIPANTFTVVVPQ